MDVIKQGRRVCMLMLYVTFQNVHVCWKISGRSDLNAGACWFEIKICLVHTSWHWKGDLHKSQTLNMRVIMEVQDTDMLFLSKMWKTDGRLTLTQMLIGSCSVRQTQRERQWVQLWGCGASWNLKEQRCIFRRVFTYFPSQLYLSTL